MYHLNKFYLIGLSFLACSTLSLAATQEESQNTLRNVVEANNLGAIVGTKKQTATNTKNQQQLATNIREGRVMLRLSARVTPQEFQRSLISVKGGDDIRVIKEFPLKSVIHTASGLSHIIVLQAYKKSTKEVMTLAKKLPGVELVEPDYLISINSTPNDPNFTALWGMDNTGQTGGTVDADIDAPEAWDITKGSANVVVGVIDTGVDYLHPDLVDNIWHNPNEIPNNNIDDDSNGYIDDIYGIDTVNNDSDPLDDNSHGTHVSGTIGAKGNNNVGVVGVNHTVNIAACKFLSASGSGSTSGAIECIDYFTNLKNNGINIVATNNSWGGGGLSQLLKDAIDNAGEAAIVFVAAAGNSNNDNDAAPSYPSSYDSDSIIAVAATDHNDDKASFSSYGATSVDLAAPGVNILSTTPSVVNCALSNDTVWSESFSDSTLSGWFRFAYDTRTPPLENNSNLWWQKILTGSGIDDSLDGNYQNYLSTTITHINPINLSDTQGTLCLGFELKGENEAYWDRLGVYITADNGGNWSFLNYIDEEALADWTPFTFVVPDDYRTADFRIALARTADSIITRSGYQVRSLQLTQNSTVSREAKYASFNGTSMATPHVTGAIALAASILPNETVAQRKARVLNNVDPLPTGTATAAVSPLYVATGGRLNVHNMVQGAPPLAGVKSDFNGDGKPDLVWRNTNSGANVLWYMDNNTKLGSATMPSVSTAWHIVGTGDFNGDGKPDLVWRNANSGANVLWYMDNNTKLGQATMPSVSTTWKLIL